MIIRHYFYTYFAKKKTNKQTKMTFPIFDQNLALTTLKKSQYGDIVIFKFL